MAKIYGVVSTKGGVGKTSFSAQFGGILADMGQRVLLVDADFQQSLSRYYIVDNPAKHGLRKLVTSADSVDCISKTHINNLDIVLSDDPTQKLLEWLRESINHSFYLTAGLKKINDDYDYIIIDSQGARGIFQESIIMSCNELISPIVPEFLDSQEFMRGTVEMLKSLEPADGIGIPMPNIPTLTGLIYKQDRTVDAQTIAGALRKKFYSASDGKIRILSAYIPMMASYKQASARRLPVHRVEVRRRSNSPTPSAYDSYLAVVHELLPHLSDVEPTWAGNGNSSASTTAKQAEA
ncbi:MAG: ParA family protein [Gammaproteobacteria bacterium]|nr:ParA family protein [Gammaproteobacteria bacterium]